MKYYDIMDSVYRDFFGKSADPNDPNYRILEQGLRQGIRNNSEYSDPDLDQALERIRAQLFLRRNEGQTDGSPESPAGSSFPGNKAAGEDGSRQPAAPEAETARSEKTAAEAAADIAACEQPESDPMEELMGLTGLSTIKQDVKELISFVKTNKLRQEKGMKTVPVSLHLVFSGNPGTGKTTVARLIARLYRQIGVLTKGQLIEVDRSQLVAGYVGQTAIQTQKKIREAMGGVLFIDEAYTLAPGAGTGAASGNDFGQEAIDTILKAMEDHRDDFVVIVAGYTDRMEKFINSNPGLKSRFNKYFEFPDYTADELMDIFLRNCGKYQYTLSEAAEKDVREHIRELETAKGENFANARTVRNYFEFIVTNQARRIGTLEDPQVSDLEQILPEDLVEEEIEPQITSAAPTAENE